MRPKSPMLLDDIRIAAELIVAFTDGRSFESYEQDVLVRSAVERQFIIIGEALARLRSADPETLTAISEHQKIIGFRHRLAHGYEDETDNAEVWRIIRSSLPVLHTEVSALLEAIEEP